MPRNAPSAVELKGGKHQTIAFGLVNVPVRIKNVKAPKRERTIGANFICEEHQVKAKQVYVCEEAGGSHAPGADVGRVKAYPTDSGYVQIDESELDELITGDGSIAIETFVPAEQVDPLFFDEHYMVGPDEGGATTYDLLCQALEEEGVIGVGTAILPGTKKTKIVAVRYSPFAEQLLLETVRFDYEINFADMDAVANGRKSRPAPTPQNVAVAVQLIEANAGEFDPSGVEDEWQKALRDAIAAAQSGKPAPVAKAKPVAVTPADDLMAKLQESVKKAKATKKPAAKKKAKA